MRHRPLRFPSRHHILNSWGQSWFRLDSLTLDYIRWFITVYCNCSKNMQKDVWGAGGKNSKCCYWRVFTYSNHAHTLFITLINRRAWWEHAPFSYLQAQLSSWQTNILFFSTAIFFYSKRKFNSFCKWILFHLVMPQTDHCPSVQFIKNMENVFPCFWNNKKRFWRQTEQKWAIIHILK